MAAPLWQTVPPSASATCLPCCAVAPAGCECALLIPPADDVVTSPYADYATAETAIADQVADCIGYVRKQSGGLITSFSADPSVANQLTMIVVGNPDNAPNCQAKMWASLSLKAGSTLTVVSTAAGGLLAGGGILYSCDGTVLDTQTGSTVTFSIASDGEYLFAAGITSSVAGFGGGSDTMTAVISSDDTLWVNPVIALWDDSGTTRSLWACPKLLLPPLTESTGTWYADCAAAAADITDWTDGCVGYFGSACTSFSATDGGTSLNLVMAYTTGSGDGAGWGGVNAEAGETLTFAYTITAAAGTPSVLITIYDDTGTLVEGLGGFSGDSPLVSAALPYTGRYTIIVSVASDLLIDSVTGDFTITSSGTMSVNEIQARYDGGLTCPNTLDCGDACP